MVQCNYKKGRYKMATVKNAIPVTRSKAHEVVYKAQEIGVTTTGNPVTYIMSMGPHLDYDMWENSTPRIGVRHYRLRVYIPDIMYDHRQLTHEQLAMFDRVTSEIKKVVQDMLLPENYRIMKHYETPKCRPLMSLIVYYQSYTK